MPRVGYNKLVYISHLHYCLWTLDFQDEHPGEERKEERATISRCTPARFWYNLKGEVMDDVLLNCLDCIMLHVTNRPGISESGLFNKLRHIFNRAELKVLVDWLKIKKCLRTAESGVYSLYGEEDFNDCIWTESGWFERLHE